MSYAPPLYQPYPGQPSTYTQPPQASQNPMGPPAQSQFWTPNPINQHQQVYNRPAPPPPPPSSTAGQLPYSRPGSYHSGYYQPSPGTGSSTYPNQGPGNGFGRTSPLPGNGFGQPMPGQRQLQGGSPQAYKNLLNKCIQENRLGMFYPPNSLQLDQIANKAVQAIPALAQRWNIPIEVANELCQLGLYDIVIFVDDSGSMAFEENGERIKDLRLILERVASVATIFDSDGISLRFMNANYPINYLENIRTEQQIHQVMDTVQFKGLTPMGTELRRKVIDSIVIARISQQRYSKPTLVIIITDGQPAGEAPNTVFDTIKFAVQSVHTQFQGGGISFQFAQVGNDLKAREFLGRLDEDPVVGKMVDCTSNYENESDEMRKKGVDLTPDLWLIKLMLGAIDSSYDSKDESPVGAGAPVQGLYPPGNYGPPQQGQYPVQQGAYGAPNQQQPGSYPGPSPVSGFNPGYPQQIGVGASSGY